MTTAWNPTSTPGVHAPGFASPFSISRGGSDAAIVRWEEEVLMTREERVAVGFAVATIVVALVFIAYALTGADLCVWCAGSP